jgi:hypothetical protein
MEPKEIEVRTPETEQIMGSDIGDAILSFLDDKAPPAKPDEPKPKPDGLEPDAAEPKPDAAKPAPADPVEEGLTAEALALEAAKEDVSKLPDGLLNDDDVGKLPDRKQREAFIKERAAHRQAREQLKELTARLQEASAKAADGEQVQELRKQIEARDADLKKAGDELAKLDLTRSPEFRKQYDDRLNQLGGRMVEALSSEGVSREDALSLVRSLVAEPKPSARENLIDDAAPGLKGTLIAFLNQFDEVSQNRALALEKAKETAAAMDEADSRARLAAMSGRVDQVTEAAVREAQALGSPYYRQVEGNEEWNAGVQARIQALKGVMVSSDLDRMATLVAEGLTAPDLRGRYSSLLKKHRALETEYREVIGHAPALGRVPPARAPAAEPKKFELGTGDIADEAARMLDAIPR